MSTVRLVEYADSWPDAFRRERARLVEVLGADALVVEHIGSTSVPGLVAKPTIDIAVGVRSIDVVLRHRGDLEALGYDVRGGFHDQHLMLRKMDGGERTHHVHFRVHPSAELDDWILFRDLLRRDPAARQRYADVKRALAVRFRDDRGAYVEAKTEVITELLRHARAAGAHTVRVVSTMTAAGYWWQAWCETDRCA